MQTRDSTNKSPIKLSAAENKLTRWFVFNTAKIPPGDFKVTTLENPLLSQQAVTSKGILVPSTNLQLNPYPSNQLNLFSSDNLSL